MNALNENLKEHPSLRHRCRTPTEPVSGRKLSDLTVLAGITGVYAHGLCTALADAGMACCCLPALDDLASVLEVADNVLLVLPEAQKENVLGAVPTSRRQSIRMALLLSGSDLQAYRRGLAAGAAGVIPAQTDLDDMISLLYSALHDRTVLPIPVLQALARTTGMVGADFTDIERHWLADLAAGRTVGQLARSHMRSEREMYRSLGRLYRRLGVSNRSAALLVAQRAGLLT